MPVLRSLLLAALVLSPAGLAQRAAADQPEGSGIIGPYFAGVIAGHRGDAASAADFLLGLTDRIQPMHEVLGPALRSAISAGRVEEALPVARQLALLDPGGSEPASLLLLTEAARTGDWGAARSQLEQLPERDLSGTRRLLLDAWMTLAQENVEAALSVLAPLAERRGLSTLHALHEALLKDVAGAPDAGEAYGRLLDADGPPSGRSVMLASNFLARSGELDRAKTLIQDQLQASRGNATLANVLTEIETGGEPAPIVADPRRGISEVFLQIGAALAEEGPEELALQEARMARHAAPENSAARLLLAEVLSRLNRHAEAVESYESLLEDPRHGTAAALARADALAAAERVDDALAAYEEIAALRQDDPEPVLRLGNLLRWERRFDESVAAYDRAVARTADPIERDWLLFYFRGISNERSGNWDQAEADFKKALALRPEQPQVLNYLGYSWVEQHRNLEEARAMLERAVELRPRDGYIVDSLGWALYRLGAFEEAVEQLERAVELSPAQAVINDHLGDAYWRVGRTREAKVQWQRTLSLGEDPDIDPEEVREKLRSGLPPVPRDGEAE